VPKLNPPPISEMMRSNLFTMEIASKNDTRQAIGSPYLEPSPTVRALRARLILEEALETIIKGLGVTLTYVPEDTDADASPSEALPIDFERFMFFPNGGLPYNEEETIDGVADTIYVCLGTLAAMGVPDLPHLDEVSRANNDKFPNGQAITDENGKFQKPHGWQPPDHARVKAAVLASLKANDHQTRRLGLREYAASLVPPVPNS
jgi:hypothetical protein